MRAVGFALAAAVGLAASLASDLLLRTRDIPGVNPDAYDSWGTLLMVAALAGLAFEIFKTD